MMSSQDKIENIENSNAIDAVERAKYVIHSTFELHKWDEMCASPTFAEIVKYFLEEEAEDNKQLLKD